MLRLVAECRAPQELLPVSVRELAAQFESPSTRSWDDRHLHSDRGTDRDQRSDWSNGQPWSREHVEEEEGSDGEKFVTRRSSWTEKEGCHDEPSGPGARARREHRTVRSSRHGSWPSQYTQRGDDEGLSRGWFVPASQRTHGCFLFTDDMCLGDWITRVHAHPHTYLMPRSDSLCTSPHIWPHRASILANITGTTLPSPPHPPSQRHSPSSPSPSSSLRDERRGSVPPSPPSASSRLSYPLARDGVKPTNGYGGYGNSGGQAYQAEGGSNRARARDGEGAGRESWEEPQWDGVCAAPMFSDDEFDGGEGGGCEEVGREEREHSMQGWHSGRGQDRDWGSMDDGTSGRRSGWTDNGFDRARARLCVLCAPWCVHLYETLRSCVVGQVYRTLSCCDDQQRDAGEGRPSPASRCWSATLPAVATRCVARGDCCYAYNESRW